MYKLEQKREKCIYINIYGERDWKKDWKKDWIEWEEKEH